MRYAHEDENEDENEDEDRRKQLLSDSYLSRTICALEFEFIENYFPEDSSLKIHPRRLFGATGFCSACSKPIPAFEMVMKAKDNVYHLDCFSCYHCNHRFCVGDRYYLIDNKIFCEVDFEERFPIPPIPPIQRLNSAIPPSSSSSSILSSSNNSALLMNKTHPHLQLNHLPGHAHLLPQPINNSQGPRLEVGQANFGGR